jgi:Amt family ammonium transporter
MGIGRSDLLGMRKDGREFPVDISLSPMQTSDGLLVAAAVRDVTERQRVLSELQATAERLQAANDTIELERTQLAERIAERTSELTAANEELVRASRFKSEFLATMSHELRTPLNGVLGMNELLLKTPLSDKQRELVDASNTSGRALLSLINDVLDLSKIEAGKLELDIHSCELRALADDVVSMFAHQAKQKGITLSRQLDPESCVTLMCDDTRLRQVLVNLLGNALKFTSAGSVTLESRCVKRAGRQIVVRFSVIDTGLGISHDKLTQLFSRFSQADRSTTRQFGGTGLGLSITKQLVELMGGTIGVTSRVGVGSTFWFEIPFDVANLELKKEERRQLLVGNKVLAIDGLDRERRQIADCLKDWGCPFEQVGTLQEAIERVASAEREGHPFAAILADCRLAIGNESVQLRDLAQNPSTPVIGLGIGEGNDLATHLRQLGLRHLLRDPVRPSELFDALKSVLEISSLSPLSDEDSEISSSCPEVKFNAHILVAEDNQINQMFVRELLKNFGCTCDVVNNGEATLAVVAQQHYDLILMDCQMPVMDGFAAAREIRRRESEGELTGRRTIIALTANALTGDRERCLDSGMDEYLSKPLQPAQLQTILTTFLPPKSQSPVL